MPNVKELEKLRPCGRLETYSTGRHHLGYFNNVGLAATYTCPAGSSKPLETIIYAALRVVIAQHSILSAIVLDEEKSHPDVYFARLPVIDLRTCVELRERKEKVPGDDEVDLELERLSTEQHSRGFKDDIGTKPFWRLIVLTSAGTTNTFTAAWFFHHALADGTSGALFHDTFLQALNSISQTSNADPVVETPSTPLPPCFEDQHPLPISWSLFLHTLAKIFLPSVFAKRSPTLWTGAPVLSALTNPTTHLRTLILSAHSTKRLAKLARKHNTSMTATLECILATALFAHLPADKYDLLTSSNPMSMRRFLKDVPNNQMMNALTTYNYTHRCPRSNAKSSLDKFDWAETRKVKETITSTLALEGRDNPIALLKYVSNIHEYLEGHRGKPHDASFEVSNIGVMKASAEGKWRLGRVVFSFCANPVGPAISMAVVTGGDGCASLSFCWGDDVDDALMGKVVEEMKDLVEGLVKEDEAGK